MVSLYYPMKTLGLHWQLLSLNQKECFCTSITAAVLSPSFYKSCNSIPENIFGFGPTSNFSIYFKVLYLQSIKQPLSLTSHAQKYIF